MKVSQLILRQNSLKIAMKKQYSLKLFWNEAMRKMKRFLKNFVASWIQIITIMTRSSLMEVMNFPAGPGIHSGII